MLVKGTILQSNYWKMTISWSVSNNSFEKFHGKKRETQHDCVISKIHVKSEMCYKGTALYLQKFDILVILCN